MTIYERDDTEHGEHYVLVGDYTRVLNERDEARAKIARQAERIRELEGATNHADGTPLTIALHERDEAQKRVVDLEKQISGLNNFSNERYAEILTVRHERDEWEKAYSAKFAEAETLRAERDEAREAIRAVLAEKWLLDPQCAEDQALVDRLKEEAAK